MKKLTIQQLRKEWGNNDLKQLESLMHDLRETAYTLDTRYGEVEECKRRTAISKIKTTGAKLSLLIENLKDGTEDTN